MDCKYKMKNNNQEKNVLIAGNGPSLKEIDYRRLPDKYDVFRCNQFYFEEKYYLGKNIKSVFFNPGFFFEQYYTSMQLILKKEYFIENIICSTFDLNFIDNSFFLKSFYNWFPEAYLGHEILNKLKDFYNYIKYNEIYYNQRITSSIYMCAIAIIFGYENIFLTGVDFYDKSKNYYAFNSKKNNLIKLNPSFSLNHNRGDFHSKDVDLKALDFLMKNYSINIYSVSPNSILSRYIKLPDCVNKNRFKIIKKHDYINDICIPADSAVYDYYKKVFSKSDKILYDTNNNKLHNIEQKINIQIQNLNQAIKNKDELITNKTTQIQNLNQAIKNKDELITNKTTQIQNLNQAIKNKDELITNKTTQIQNLNQAIKNKDELITNKTTQIQNLNQAIKNKDELITNKTTQIQNLNQAIKNKDELITNKTTQIQNLNQAIKNKDELITNKTTQIQNLNQAIKNKDELIQNTNNLLSFQTKYGTAKTRIQNQLSYKLGQAMILNSKSILGYLIMPMALLSIIISHKQEQKIYQEKIKKDPSLKLPPLESYPDYKEALKLKNHLSYKLGEALIQANKTWYKGGYVKILFEIGKLKREFRNRKI
ncbi:alpha-2,3-sialyltransferase [Campylobacter jejuni]|nr:alpha-2,3-sialyltransferase [Campylobacter jejuni]